MGEPFLNKETDLVHCSECDSVIENVEILIINRGKDSGVVVISLDEYNSLNATQHELSSRANESRLDSAIDKLKSKESFQKGLLDS